MLHRNFLVLCANLKPSLCLLVMGIPLVLTMTLKFSTPQPASGQAVLDRNAYGLILVIEVVVR